MMSHHRLMRRLRRRRGTILVLTLFFFGCVGMASLFGLHMIAVSTSAHSRLTETAQASAYAAASAVSGRGRDSGGVISIDPAEANARAQQVIRENLTGQFGLRPENVSVNIQVHNVTLDTESALQVIDPNTCQPLGGMGYANIGTWQDAFGDCHLTSGVRVELAITIRPCLFSGFAEKTCPAVTIRGDGYADYAYRGATRISN